jgi:hypothetical protein
MSWTIVARMFTAGGGLSIEAPKIAATRPMSRPPASAPPNPATSASSAV